MSLKSVLAVYCLFVMLLSAPVAAADSLNVAVASNFAGTLQKLAERFKSKSGHEVLISSASTGKIYTQIKNGAPFDIFMSADETHVDLLVKEGMGDASHAAIYALGKLMFISNIALSGKCQDVLSDAKLRHLAIANPQTAPYGVAAQQVMQRLGVWNKLQSKLVLGENIAQTLQYVVSTSADAGFVAKSILVGDVVVKRACEWAVPDELYTPISQKMVLINQSRAKPAVLAFWDFMRTAEAVEIIRTSGYDVPKLE
jgi:molybdate transport system substrate-binding protein